MIIRDKYSCSREIVPKTIIFGNSPFVQRKDGAWFDPETGKDCVELSLDDLNAPGLDDSKTP